MALDALKTNNSQRVPTYSRLHPVIPKLYVPEWKTDMINRKLIGQNAREGSVPHFEHDENLFLERREQMSYNVEDRVRVEQKYKLPPRAELLKPASYHHTAKYQSSLMSRK